MEKERAIQCIPAEMLARLKGLAERLWAENNPSSVHINAILEEFAPDIKALGQIVKEYESDYASRLTSKSEDHTRREARLKEEVVALRGNIAALEKENAANLDRVAEYKAAVHAAETRISELQSKAMDEEREINLKYVAKMQELYDRTNKKEMEMLAKWEEKNRSLEARTQAVEEDYSGRVTQFELRGKALEADAKARKAELIKTFDRIQAELDAREKATAARERALAYWEKTGSRKDGEPQ
jgi:chromosome segregation ATPase